MADREPWHRFEAQVDPGAVLSPAERARRAKIAYRAFMRRIARKSAKARAANKTRRDAAHRRSLVRGPSQKSVEAFQREQEAWFADLAIIMAARRGQRGIEQLRRHQRKVRSDCLLCHRAFTETDRSV